MRGARILGVTDLWNDGNMENKKSYSGKPRKYGGAKRGVSDSRSQESTEVRSFNGTLKPLMSEEDASRDQWNHGSTEQRTFGGALKPLMSEAEKEKDQVLELSYDFSCGIIRLYKYLNEGKLSKADRDIIDALGRQLVRSATSINANMNEAQHPQSDSDFLSKASIALKESRESETWLHMFSDNGYLDQRMSESILHDCARINKILIIK